MYYIFFLLSFLFGNTTRTEDLLEISSLQTHQASSYQKVKLLLGIIKNKNEDTFGFDECIKQLQKNLSLSDQLNIIVKEFDIPKTKQEVTDLFVMGYPLVVFIDYLDKENELEWRLYDSMQAEMVKGGKYKSSKPLGAAWANAISQKMWPELSLQPGIFTTKIGYIKQLNTGQRYRSQVCIADFDGSNEQVLLDMQTIFVQLTFHPDPKRNCLFVSEFTQDGIKLLMVDFNGRKKTIFAQKRSIAGVSLSSTADRVVYIDSGDIWRYSYNNETKSGKHELLVQNDQKCSSAILCPDGNVLYCSDYVVYRYNYLTKESRPVLSNALAPTYCPANRNIVFSRRVKNYLQLMLFNEQENKTEQITFNEGNKSDSCFSPCGNYIIFCHEKRGKKMLSILCLATKKQRPLPLAGKHYSYPAWSPYY